jgi:hypothetical protein
MAREADGEDLKGIKCQNTKAEWAAYAQEYRDNHRGAYAYRAFLKTYTSESIIVADNESESEDDEIEDV